MPRTKSSPPVRYAVVGLGYFAQIAVLPAFEKAKNSRLAALISGDPIKLRQLGKKYRVGRTYSYQRYDECLRSGEIDAVYIVLPNDLHAEYAIRAAQAGIHVLCEKPMAATEEECRAMMNAADAGRARLMIAYRLHLEAANLEAAAIANSGRLGDVRIFNSVFTQQVNDDNIRTQTKHAGGTLFDMGVYCINAARSVFRAEPVEVTAFSASNDDPRFHQVDEMTSAVMRFPGERLASFTCSFGAADAAAYEVVGTKGSLRLNEAYGYASGHTLTWKAGKRSGRKKFPKRNQIAAELAYFSDCVRRGKDPEPSGTEGFADVRIVRALYESARTGRPVRLEPLVKEERPDRSQEIDVPASGKPELIRAKPATKKD